MPRECACPRPPSPAGTHDFRLTTSGGQTAARPRISLAAGWLSDGDTGAAEPFLTINIRGVRP